MSAFRTASSYAAVAAMTLCAGLTPAWSSTPGVPEIFAPGVISGAGHEAAPAFTPDGKTVYFQRSTPAGSVILVSHFARGKWSAPEIAPFSGEWNDIEPAMAPDGSFLVFISSRPITPGGKSIEGFYNGQAQDGGNLWRVDRERSGWSKPVRLPETVNRGTTMFAPAIAGDGSLYFMEPFGAKSRFRLYRSQYRDGQYEPAEPLPFSDGSTTDVDPAVSPDERFLIFGSGRPPAKGNIDLFIVQREGGQWGTPVHLGDVVNSPTSDAEPRLGTDGHTLYFSSERTLPQTFPRTPAQARADLARVHDWDTGQYNIWKLDIMPWLNGGPQNSH